MLFLFQSPTISIDWTISVVAIGSLLLSIITLYLTHLRGPDINLAIPNKIYPCHGIHTTALHPYPPNEKLGHFVIVTRLIVANTGIRPGLLFSFRVDPKDSAVFQYELSPHPENGLPITLPQGEGWQTMLSVQIRSDDDSWLRALENKPSVNFKVVYLVSASFGRKIQKKVDLRIDLKPLYASVKSAS